MENVAREASAYDFVHPDHKLSPRWPILDLVHGTVATRFGQELASRLQFPVRAVSQPATHSRYNEFVESLKPTSLVHEIALHPLPGVLWLSIDASLVYALVDAYFGGTGKLVEHDKPRIMSGTERRVLTHILDAFSEALAAGWAQVIAATPTLVQFVATERLGRAARSQVVVSTELMLNWGNYETPVRLAYPYSMLEPVGAKLERDDHIQPAQDRAFSEAIGRELLGCELEVHGVLGETRMTLAQLLAMKPGDFIPLRDVQTVCFKSEDMPLFDARVGVSNGRVSASLSHWHLRRGVDV